MRLWPESSSEGYVGIGDFFAASATPLDRLDLVNGNLRIRSLPGTSSTSDTKVMVVDANGVVHWRPDTDIAGAGDCEWEFSGLGEDVVTAVGASDPDCPLIQALDAMIESAQRRRTAFPEYGIWAMPQDAGTTDRDPISDP